MPRTGVTKTCTHCNQSYYVSPSRAKSSRYCGKACFDAAQTTSERKTFTCQGCGDSFVATDDHGKPRKFCSRECFTAKAPKPEWKNCPSCGMAFLAGRGSHDGASADGLRVYCSHKCRHEGLKRGETRNCACCGKEFWIRPSKSNFAKDESCCSVECRRQFYTASRAAAWRGGSYVSSVSGAKMVYRPASGNSKYWGEHRLVASRAVGRLLATHEKVLHINNIPTDNRPENLFICGSANEAGSRIHGGLPWPTKSNLGSYK